MLSVRVEAESRIRKDSIAFVLKHGGHTYESRWYEWLVDLKPVYYFSGDHIYREPEYNPDHDAYYETGDGGVLQRYVGPGGTLVLPKYIRSVALTAFDGAQIVLVAVSESLSRIFSPEAVLISLPSLKCS